MFSKIKTLFQRLSLFVCGYTWKETDKVVDDMHRWETEDRDVSRKIFSYFRILNKVDGLKVWISSGSPFSPFSGDCHLHMTLEGGGFYDNKTQYFTSIKGLLAFMESGLCGTTLSTKGKSFTFPSFRTKNELEMKLQLMGLID